MESDGTVKEPWLQTALYGIPDIKETTLSHGSHVHLTLAQPNEYEKSPNADDCTHTIPAFRSLSNKLNYQRLNDRRNKFSPVSRKLLLLTTDKSNLKKNEIDYKD